MSNIIGQTVLLDTNAIIYYLDEPVSEVDFIIENNDLSTSIINEIEVFGYDLDDQQIQGLTRFFQGVRVQPISSDIKRKAIYIKRVYKIKTADSIIAATAVSLNIPLVSADQELAKVNELNLIQITPPSLQEGSSE